MPRRKRAASPFELYDDDLDDDSQSSRNGNPPIQRNAANARERARMRVLSSAFGRLKTKLPNIPPDTKLSKLDTLRLATMYIKNLRAMAEGNINTATSMSADAIGPMQFAEHGNIFGLTNGAQNLSWPFGLHHIQNTTTNRQLPLHQCPLMEWSQTTATAQSKCNTDSFTSQHHSQSVTPPWYSSHNANSMASTASHSFHSNNNNNFNNVCNSSNQIPQHHQQNQNQQDSHGFRLHASMQHHQQHHHHHHQSAMSPIR